MTTTVFLLVMGLDKLDGPDAKTGVESTDGFKKIAAEHTSISIIPFHRIEDPSKYQL
ncbi:MAG: hypothetical protein Crog4KO_16900 [Crocinitomicaceae bacterium]